MPPVLPRTSSPTPGPDPRTKRRRRREHSRTRRALESRSRSLPLSAGPASGTLSATTGSLNCGITCSLPFSLLQVGGIKHVVQPSPPNLPPTTRAFSPSQTDSPRWTLAPRPPPRPPASRAVPMRPAPAGSPCERFHTAPALSCLVYLFHGTAYRTARSLRAAAGVRTPFLFKAE